MPLADTTFLIDLMEKRNEAVSKARELEEKGIPIFVSSPSVFELYVGVSLSKRAQEAKSKIASVVEALPQLPFDLEAAKAAGILYGERMKAGSQIDPEDAMLAGISKVRGEAVITRNVKHFSNLEDVRVDTY